MQPRSTIAENLLRMAARVDEGVSVTFYSAAEAGLFVDGIIGPGDQLYGGGRGMALILEAERHLLSNHRFREVLIGVADLTASRAANGQIVFVLRPWDGKAAEIVRLLREAAEKQPGHDEEVKKRAVRGCD